MCTAGLLALVFIVIGVLSTIGRTPAVSELHAQSSWRGLVGAALLALRGRRLPIPQSVADRRAVGRGLRSVRSVHRALVLGAELGIRHRILASVNRTRFPLAAGGGPRRAMADAPSAPGRRNILLSCAPADGRRSSRSAMVTGQTALCGPHHATRPTMRSQMSQGIADQTRR